MKPYRLLRNNKESGPYTANELIQMGLKAYDLVWVDGKSASWRYPCEITELKPYAPEVEEQPFDRFFRKPSTTQAEKKTEMPAAVQVNTVPTVAVPPPKPRIRIKADSMRIETPVYQAPPLPSYPSPHTPQPFQQPEPTIPPAATTPGVPDSPDWKAMWLDWEKEKKAVQEASKVNVAATLQSVNRTHGSVNENYASVNGRGEMLETKFSQSLDDIKEQYIETVLKKSRKTPRKSNLTTVLVLVGAILAIGIWVGVKWSEPGNTDPGQRIVQTKPEVQKEQPEQFAYDNGAQPNQDDAADNAKDQGVQTSDAETRHQTAIPQSAVAKKTSLRTYKPKAVSAQNYPVKKAKNFVENTPQQREQPAQTQQTAARDNGGETPVVDPHTAAISKFKKSEPRISDYISVSGGNSSRNAVGVSLQVQNISDIPVDLVMIDVQYYDDNGRFEKGETVYVRGIAAGQAVNVRVPDNSQAARVAYKVSMVSSENNNLYLIAD